MIETVRHARAGIVRRGPAAAARDRGVAMGILRSAAVEAAQSDDRPDPVEADAQV